MKYRTNLLAGIKKTVLDELIPLYGKEESSAMLDILIEEYFGLSKTGQALNREYRLSESEMLKIESAVKKLKRFVPLQYILGKTEFMGLTLSVNGSVLIPRPETEEMVHTIVKETAGRQLPASILDIGTGSGAIAIALKRAFPKAEVQAVDISQAALAVAAENAEANKTPVTFIKADILNPAFHSRLPHFDLIVSNPPYVTHSEIKMMRKNVLEYEPREALFVPDNDPLLFYRAIATLSKEHLQKTGRLYLEINEAYASGVSRLLTDAGFGKVKVYKDIHGKDRFVKGVI